ncbi:MAG: hypothetical protein HYT93_04030 [Parcubacteria group bacterium]|nr:hypothetical protein [Parcubacteria group bacterium]
MTNNFEKQKNANESPAEDFSATVQDLYRRSVESRDSNVEWVGIKDGRFVEVPPGATEEKVMWTYGLCDCNTVAVFVETEDGTRACALTYYPPDALLTSMGKLRALIPDEERIKSAKIKKAIFALPGVRTQNPDTKQEEIQVLDKDAINGLTLVVEKELGSDVEIIIAPYDEHPNPAVKDEGTLVIHIPPAGKGDAWYQTWSQKDMLTNKSYA